MITLTIWSDFACPYCYIGETRLQRAIEELGLIDDVIVDYRAFELDPYSPKEVTTTTPERFASKYHLTLEEAIKHIEQIEQLGKELGIDFRYKTTKYSNTRDAHRLMKFAEAKYSRETVSKLNEALFKAYFSDNLVLAEADVLVSVAESVGINGNDVKAMLESDAYKDEVRFDEREAAMRGVHGVPYIVFNGGFAVPGAMSIDGFKSALKRELKKQSTQTSEKEGETPHVCGPDGCKLL